MSGGPYKDASIYEAIQYEKEKRQPHCCICGEPIYDDYLYDFLGAIYCEDCMNNTYRQPVEDYIGGI